MNDTYPTSPERLDHVTVTAALAAASTKVAELGFDPAFQDYLVHRGVRPDTDDPEMYWGAVADYTEEMVTNPELSAPLERDSLALVANLPHALTNQYHLDHYRNSMDYRQKRQATTVMCSYNNLLKQYVTMYAPQAEQLHEALLGATLETMGDDSADFTRHAETTLRDIFKGIRHEIGFTRILDTLPAEIVSYRDATVEEDLKGKDVVLRYEGREIGIDVKASLDQVDGKNHGSNGTPIAHKANGDLVMWSMLREADFNGGFTPEPEQIDTIAPVAAALLQRALAQPIAKK